MGVEDVDGIDAYKIAMHHKGFGDGHLLLSAFMEYRAEYAPFKLGAYLYVDKTNGTLLQVNNENEEVVFD
ncbi:hypothetical protein [Lunatibacter salilacus]|uniref:hypothetical protein n=1 Tax=Lunatibacter salilacus TaxID=2483804 RepID=UPI00131D832A|nr:hypothetical protein [Lunatibacter salilacus]